MNVVSLDWRKHKKKTEKFENDARENPVCMAWFLFNTIKNVLPTLPQQEQNRIKRRLENYL